MAEQWHFVPDRLQRIEKYPPNAGHNIQTIGQPIGGPKVIEEFFARNPVEARVISALLGGYTHVYSVTNDKGEIEYYLASGSATSQKVL